jgi:hypothetical protein
MSARKVWSPSDEEAFQRLAREREEIRGAHEAGVRLVASSVLSTMQRITEGEPTLAGNVALGRAMIQHAESVRDALKPFDSGVRVGEAAPG